MEIVAQPRSDTGSGHSRRMRHSGSVPGVLYGGTAAPELISLPHKELYFALQKEVFHSSILDLKINGKKQPVLLRDYQMHAFKQLVLHVDFQRVDVDKKITVKVPLHFINQENSPAVKLFKGLVSHVANEVEVSCLPKDLPDHIVVDLSNLAIDASLHLNDVVMPKGVTAIAQNNPTLVTVRMPVEADEATPSAAAPSSNEAAKPADNKAKK